MATNSQVNNALIVKYLEDFPHNVEFDAKYKDSGKYLIYKYIKFSLRKPLPINSVELTFVVDNVWYEKNGIVDVLFFRFINGEWSRVAYNSKITTEKYKQYKVISTALGDYWAIVGVLPEENILNKDIQSKTIVQHKSVLKSIKEIKSLEDIVDIGREVVVVLKDPVQVKGAAVIATTTATISVVTLMAFLNGPVSLWIILQQIGTAFLGLFFSRKKYGSGIVYDANTGIPVSLVRIDLIDKNTNKIKVTKFTDKHGEYYFLVPQGKYYLELRKRGYKTINNKKKHLLKALLHESDVNLGVELNEAGIVKKNIAILKSEDFSHKKLGIFLLKMLKYLINILFVIGIMVSVWSCYVMPTLFNFIILSIYLLIILFKAFFIKNIKYGIVVDSNHNPEAFATISVLDAKTQEVISRVISDTNGRYYLTLEKGDYILSIKTVKGVSVKRRMKVENKNILSKKIIIQK